jgi:hypothetical protein
MANAFKIGDEVEFTKVTGSYGIGSSGEVVGIGQRGHGKDLEFLLDISFADGTHIYNVHESRVKVVA